MQFIVKFVAAIIPYLLRFMDKHADEYLEKLSNKLINMLDDEKYATIKFHIINTQGEPVANAMASFNMDIFGKVYKKAEGSMISITGFKEGTYSFGISANGYEIENVNIDIVDTNTIIEKTLVLR